MSRPIRYKPVWARIVSDLLSPPVTLTVVSILATLHETDSSQFPPIFYAVIFFVVSVLVPVLYLGWLLHQGKITDMHTPISSERQRPLLLSSICSFIVLVIYILTGSPKDFLLLAVFAVIANISIGFITLFWHISVHGTVVTGITGIAIAIFGVTAAVLFVPIIVVVVAARLALKRHTPMQLIAGIVLGSSALLLSYAIVYR